MIAYILPRLWGHQITKCSMDTLSVLQTLVCLDTHFLSVQETLDETLGVSIRHLFAWTPSSLVSHVHFRFYSV